MGAESVLTTGNYPLSSAAASLFLNSPDLSFLMNVKSDVIKDVSFAKKSELFAFIEALHIFFLFLNLLSLKNIYTVV